MRLIFAGVVLVVCGGVLLISTVFGDTAPSEIEPVRIGKPDPREADEGRTQRADGRDRRRQPHHQGQHEDGSSDHAPAVVAPAPAGTDPVVPSGGGAPDESGGDDEGDDDGSPQPGPSPSQPAPQPEPAPAPAPSPVPTDDDGEDEADGESADD